MTQILLQFRPGHQELRVAAGPRGEGLVALPVLGPQDVAGLAGALAATGGRVQIEDLGKKENSDS